MINATAKIASKVSIDFTNARPLSAGAVPSAAIVKVPLERVMITIQKYGNPTAATTPLCLWDYESKLKAGDRLILAAFGGGFTWGGAYLTWAYDTR